MVEYIGYAAMVLVAVSLSMKNIIWLRILNLGGAISFVVYEFLRSEISYPIVGLNVYLAVVNIYYLVREKSEKNKKKLANSGS